MNNNLISQFKNSLVGKYSNKEQAQKSPQSFANINIFFRPLDFLKFGRNAIYTEQSYEFNLWAPYRQSVLFIKNSSETIILENYAIQNKDRVAGAGSHPELLDELDKAKLENRIGCDMHFRKIAINHFKGQIEPGQNCIIKHGYKSTYLSSKAELLNDMWICQDEGLDIETNLRVWGSENGQFIFKKIKSYAL